MHIYLNGHKVQLKSGVYVPEFTLDFHCRRIQKPIKYLEDYKKRLERYYGHTLRVTIESALECLTLSYTEREWVLELPIVSTAEQYEHLGALVYIFDVLVHCPQLEEHSFSIRPIAVNHYTLTYHNSKTPVTIKLPLSRGSLLEHIGESL